MSNEMSLNTIVPHTEVHEEVVYLNRKVKGVTVDKNVQFCVGWMAAILDLHNKSRILQLKTFVLDSLTINM